MKTAINLDKKTGLLKLGRIVAEAIKGTIATVAGGQVSVQVLECNSCTADDLLEDFANEAVITGTDSKSGSEAGLLFKIGDITSVADYMLMGDGTGANTLDDSAKDAVKELSSQIFGSVAVQTETQLGNKWQVKVSDVSVLKNTDNFLSMGFIKYDMQAVLNDKTLKFSFFMDSMLSAEFDEEDGFVETPLQQVGKTSVDNSSGSGSNNMEMLLDIDIPVSVRMGTAKLFLKDVLGLGPGNIVELDQTADSLIELTVNDKTVARGEVVIVDGYFGFRIKEIISKTERIKHLKD